MSVPVHVPLPFYREPLKLIFIVITMKNQSFPSNERTYAISYIQIQVHISKHVLLRIE